METNQETNTQAESHVETQETQETQEVNTTPKLDDLSPNALKQAYEDSQRKLHKASQEAGKYRLERNELKASIEAAKEEALKAERTELENAKAEIAKRDELLEQERNNTKKIQAQMRQREQLTGKVSDVNLAMAALTTLSADDRESLESDGKLDIEQLIEKFPALKLQVKGSTPTKGAGGNAKPLKSEEEMSDEEFFANYGKKK